MHPSVSKLMTLALALLFCSAAGAEPARPPVDPSIGKVEVTLELPKDKPYVGEMIMLHMRSFVRADIVLDEVRQPALTNFDTQQLGRDKPISAMVDGFQVAGIQRDLAIFPQQSGRLIIEPFVRHVTIQTEDNQRVQLDFASKRLFVDVQNHNGVGEADAWWLPAKSVSVTDNWSTEPDEIKPGTLARRTVVVEAVGLTADRLPPAPKILAPGTIAFKGPAERTTTITPDGPVARATYQWDIRPTSGSPAKLPAIRIGWFDTVERRLRNSAIPDLWIAYLGTMVHTAHEKAKTWTQIYFSTGPVAIATAAFAWTVAVAALLLTARRTSGAGRRRLRRNLRALRRAARFNDEAAFRQALDGLARDDPATVGAALKRPEIATPLAALDAARYAPTTTTMTTTTTAPALAPIAAIIARSIEPAVAAADDGRSALPSLDAAQPGPDQERRVAWSARLRRAFAAG